MEKKIVILVLILVKSINVMGQSKQLKSTETSHSYSVSFIKENYLEIKNLIEDQFDKADLTKDDVYLWMQSDEKKYLSIQLLKNKINVNFNASKKGLKTEDKIKKIINKINSILDIRPQNNQTLKNYHYDSH